MNRRAFLKLGAALGAAAAVQLPPGAALASTLPLPVPHHYFPNAETLLAHDLRRFDLLLVPAYAAAELIRRGALRPLNGPPGRAHDPDGAFTIPYAFGLAALAYRGARPQSFADLWLRDSLWPDEPRLVLGAALLRRGWSPNDSHPGRLAQVERDLLELRPRVVAHPAAGLRALSAAVALTSVLSGAGETGQNVAVPTGGTILIEYDWAIPASAANPDGALVLIENARARRAAPRLQNNTHLIPLAALPSAALAQRAAIWNQLRS